MTFLRSRLSRWLAAVSAVVVVLAVGKCRPEDAEETEAPRRTAPFYPPKAKQIIPDDIAAWSQRFTAQRPPPEELRADPSQQSGTLENGIRYIVLEDPAAAGEVSLRLMVLAGSMHEAPGEEGFAHFIEHLAFQVEGGGSALAVFERLGLASGADTNAHTALDHTLYRLDLPAADETTLETACAFLGRTAGGMSFSDATVDDERRVILREIDERPQSADLCRRAAAILPGVPAFRHPPGGTRESIGAASRAALWDFWHRHYVPSRMVVVAVGDLKAEPMIARLRRHFAEIPSRTAPPEPDRGDPLAAASSPATLAVSGSTQVELRMAIPHPATPEPDSLAKRRSELVRAVALTMLESRLAREFSREQIAGAPPRASAVEMFPGTGWLELSSSADPQDAPRVLRSLVLGWRSALDHEFHRAEFAEAVGKVRRSVRQAFLSRLAQGTADLARHLAEAERTGRLVQSPEDELNRRQADLATVTRQECEALLRAEWSVTPRLLLSGAIDAGLAASASGIVADALGETPPPHVHGTIDAAWIAEPPGSPGRVIRRRLDESRGLLEAEFANGVLARLVPIPSLGGYVQVQVDIGHGRQSLPPDQPALATAAGLLCRWHPIKGWPDLALNAALAHDDVSRSFGVGRNSFQWTGETDRGQLRRQLDLLAALVHRSGLADLPRVWTPDEHARAWDEKVRRGFPAKMREMERLLGGSDPRFELVPEGLMQTDGKQVADWLLPLLSGERLCVSLAGDFEPEAALAAVAASFGCLPARPPWEDASPHPAPPVTEPGLTRLPLEKSRTASVVLLFSLGPAGDAAEMLRRRLLEETLQLRVREVMREQRGDSYAPRVERRLPADPAAEWLVVDVPCRRGQADETSAVLHELVREFRDRGWTRDEFQRALRPLPHAFAHRARHPLQVVEDLQQPARIPAPEQLAPAALADLEDAVRELARRALDPEKAVELRVDR